MIIDAMLPAGDEKAVFFCIVCKTRTACTTIRAARAARASHKRATGHGDNAIFQSVTPKKRGAK